MIITYNLKPFFKKDLGSFSKSYLKHKLWVVKLLKLNIEKSWFDYQDTRCCNLAILNVLPKLLPDPNLHFRFMKNSVRTSLLWSLVASIWPINKYDNFRSLLIKSILKLPDDLDLQRKPVNDVRKVNHDRNLHYL